MNASVLPLYKFHDHTWVKTSEFGPHNMVSIINEDHHEIWVWEGPWVPVLEKKVATNALKKIKLLHPNYTVHRMTLKPKEWKKPHKLQRHTSFPESACQQLTEAFQSQSIINPDLFSWNRLLHLISFGAFVGFLLVWGPFYWTYLRGNSIGAMVGFSAPGQFTRIFLYGTVMGLVLLTCTLMSLGIGISTKKIGIIGPDAIILTIAIGILFWYWPMTVQGLLVTFAPSLASPLDIPLAQLIKPFWYSMGAMGIMGLLSVAQLVLIPRAPSSTDSQGQQ